MRVLLNAGPWLSVPPAGYGGIENVVATLVPALRDRGVQVVLATVGTSTIAADEVVFRHPVPQFPLLQLPYNRVMGCVMAHMDHVVRELARREDVDLVHDHVEAVGPVVLAALGSAAPPALHTLHWDLGKHPALYENFDGRGRVRVNGVSADQLYRAPAALRAASLGHVHLATPLAGRRAGVDKGRYAIVLGRITPGKGQDVAARLAHAAGQELVLAGPVGPYDRPAALARALRDDPDALRNPDVQYWQERVRPWVDGRCVRWVGSVGPAKRDALLAGALVSLCPLQWDEPGGTAVVESLALGTPVAGYRRGCLPELVDDGGTGLLVAPGDEDGLVTAWRNARRLDPRTCRRVAAERFSPSRMADDYVSLYEKVCTGQDSFA
ncbi:glycosyltransferase [Amycolatopsis thermalba]|uniref:Glycosyltransferase n=1 Tax=Amycolatopsis thermalba TaxID=944492 RepID=A0ABY4P0I7_9PSEU|nr:MULTISPECIES: glycosyltransferase [Amycolatopsis]UQS25871.1 glycosyltransferase [Amycolatopsis thermalba]